MSSHWRQLAPAAVAAAVFSAAVAAPAWPAPQPPADATPFFERVDVDVINVEAYVTDKKGDAVADLTAADFEILEDGKPVEITNFFRNERVAPPAPAAPAAGKQGPGPAAVAAPARELPDEQQVNLVVYVDLFNLRPTTKNRVLQQLGGFLADRIRQGDRVMTVAHKRNVMMVHPFTRDFAVVEAGLAKLREMSTDGQITDAERKRVHRAIFLTNAETRDQDMITAFDEIKSFIQQQSLENAMCMDALSGLLRSLGGVPGRRALLYVSDGLEQEPGADLLQIFRDLYGNNPRGLSLNLNAGQQRALSEQSATFRRATDAANTYQVTLYTLQARGAGGITSLGADQGDTSAAAGGVATANAARELSEQEPLLTLAEQTGGTAIINTSNFAGVLADLSQSFDSLYSLGYRSRGGGDGKYHKIEVKVKRPGLEVRHRKGYVDAPESQRVADRAFSSLILGREANPLEITVDFATAKADGAGKYQLPLLIKIPLRQLALLPDGEKQRGKLRIYFAVQNPDGALSQMQEVPYPVEIPAAEAEQLQDKEIGYAVKLVVREGQPTVAVGVWDEVAGIESHLLRSVRVPGAAPAEASR